jgi:endogenous inhibitor of DNA gyrase (YacG/DUF329 family)
MADHQTARQADRFFLRSYPNEKRHGAGLTALRDALTFGSFIEMRCAICKRPVDLSPANKFRPFCSERCQMIDLGTWASEKYRVAGKTVDETEHPDDDLSTEALKNKRHLN